MSAKQFASPAASIVAAVLGCAALSCGSVASADEPVEQVNNRIAADLAVLGLHYQEFEGDPKHVQDSDKGFDLGGEVSASGLFSVGSPHETLFAGLSYIYANGTMTHSGLSLKNGSPITPYQAGERFDEVMAEVGAPAHLSSRLLLILTASLEYREWNRSIPNAGLSTKERYTFYAPGAALRASYELSPRWVLSGRAGVAYTVDPRNAGNANPASGSPAAVYQLGERPLYQGSVRLDYVWKRHVSLQIGADYSHFHFGASQDVLYELGGIRHGEYEPESTTDEAIVRAGAAYLF